MSFLGLFYDLCFFRSRLNASQKNDVYFNFWCDFTRQRKKGHFLWFECFSNFGVYDFYRALEGLEAGNTRKWAEQFGQLGDIVTKCFHFGRAALLYFSPCSRLTVKNDWAGGGRRLPLLPRSWPKSGIWIKIAFL